MRRRAILAVAGAGALAATAAPALGDRPAPAVRAGTTHTVRLGEYFYRPKRLVIRAGDRVRFVNVGKIEHTVADSTRGGRIRSRVIKPRPLRRRETQVVRLTRRGTLHYVCTFHPDLMRGVIVVR